MIFLFLNIGRTLEHRDWDIEYPKLQRMKTGIREKYTAETLVTNPRVLWQGASADPCQHKRRNLENSKMVWLSEDGIPSVVWHWSYLTAFLHFWAGFVWVVPDTVLQTGWQCHQPTCFGICPQRKVWQTFPTPVSSAEPGGQTTGCKAPPHTSCPAVLRETRWNRHHHPDLTILEGTESQRG